MRRDRRVLPGHPAAGPGRRRAARSAPGVCRAALDQAVLPLQRGALARRRPGRSGAAARSGSTVATPSWRHVYNLDVLSVPDKWEYPWFAAWDTAFHCIVLARLDPEWAKRQVRAACFASGTCTRAASSRRTSGTSPTPIRRCMPTPPGGSTRSTRDADRRGGYRLPRGGFPQAAAQLHLVGQPQGPRGPQRVSGGLPRPGQHRRFRPQPAQPGREADGSSRPTEPPGWGCSASTCWRSRWNCRRPGRLTRRSPPSSSSTSWRSRTRSTGSAARSACGTRTIGFYYDVVRVKGGPPEHLKVRSFVGLIPLFAVPGDRAGYARAAAAFSPAGRVVHSLSPDAGRQPLPA